jgi:hypothetical protein
MAFFTSLRTDIPVLPDEDEDEEDYSTEEEEDNSTLVIIIYISHQLRQKQNYCFIKFILTTFT